MNGTNRCLSFSSRDTAVWGAHAPRVLVSAPSPKQSSGREVRWVSEKKKKFAMTGTSSPAREGACAPQNAFDASSLFIK